MAFWERNTKAFSKKGSISKAKSVLERHARD